jgi:hypothetical protein
VNLEPLREAVLEQARADSARIRAEASARAAETLGRAEREGVADVERARAEGAAAGRSRGGRRLAAARREARRLVLEAKRDLHDELCARARASSLAVREEAGYPALLDVLAAAARRRLGEHAVLEVDPADVGGVRAAAGDRSVDYTLVALTDRCLERLRGRIEELWA